VHSGAVERGTVDGLRSVLWYADLRGFTRISDVSSGAAIVDMLNDTFEILTAALRSRGGHVLKFIGDALLATISFDEPDEKATCRRALDAAVEASATRSGTRALSRVVAVRASKGCKSDDASLRPLDWRRTRSVSLSSPPNAVAWMR
jgi:adenylate cyclase